MNIFIMYMVTGFMIISCIQMPVIGMPKTCGYYDSCLSPKRKSLPAIDFFYRRIREQKDPDVSDLHGFFAAAMAVVAHISDQVKSETHVLDPERVRELKAVYEKVLSAIHPFSENTPIQALITYMLDKNDQWMVNNDDWELLEGNRAIHMQDQDIEPRKIQRMLFLIKRINTIISQFQKLLDYFSDGPQGIERMYQNDRDMYTACISFYARNKTHERCVWHFMTFFANEAETTCSGLESRRHKDTVRMFQRSASKEGHRLGQYGFLTWNDIVQGMDLPRPYRDFLTRERTGPDSTLSVLAPESFIMGEWETVNAHNASAVDMFNAANPASTLKAVFIGVGGGNELRSYLRLTPQHVSRLLKELGCEGIDQKSPNAVAALGYEPQTFGPNAFPLIFEQGSHLDDIKGRYVFDTFTDPLRHPVASESVDAVFVVMPTTRENAMGFEGILRQALAILRPGGVFFVLTENERLASSLRVLLREMDGFSAAPLDGRQLEYGSIEHFPHSAMSMDPKRIGSLHSVAYVKGQTTATHYRGASHSGQTGGSEQTYHIRTSPGVLTSMVIAGAEQGVKSSYHADLFVQMLPLLSASFERRTGRHILRACETGTARGTVAVALALMCRGAHILAVDYLQKYADLAAQNAVRNNVAGRFRAVRGDILEPARESAPYDVLVSTLPSMVMGDADESDLDNDSFIEMSGGKTGNELLLRFIRQAPALLKPDGEVWLTMFEFSGLERVLAEMRMCGFEPEVFMRKRKYLDETMQTRLKKTAIEAGGYTFLRDETGREYFNVIIVRGRLFEKLTYSMITSS